MNVMLQNDSCLLLHLSTVVKLKLIPAQVYLSSACVNSVINFSYLNIFTSFEGTHCFEERHPVNQV